MMWLLFVEVMSMECPLPSKQKRRRYASRYCRSFHANIKTSFEEFGISFDNYSRTSAKIHHETASEFFKTLYDKGEFIEETTAQLYDAEANQFLADRFVVGTCPKCGNEESYGDQCEACGTHHNATDLIKPKSRITGAIPTLKETKHWFLPSINIEAFLKEWILEGHKARLETERLWAM